MPKLRVDDELTLHYADDDFTDPWAERENVLLIHGFAESGRVWFAWVPHLGRRLRVLRPDLRGFGRSSAPPRAADYPWSVAGMASDLARFLDMLELPSVHVVGSRVGGPIGAQLAADHPARVSTLTIVSGLMRGSDMQGLRQSGGGPKLGIGSFGAEIRRRGREAFFADTQRSRMGTGMSEEQLRWFSELMASSRAGVCVGFISAAAGLDLYETLPRVAAPTLVLAAEGSKVQSIETTREWQSRIPNSTLLTLSGDSPHLAAERPDECAAHALSFIERHSAG